MYQYLQKNVQILRISIEMAAFSVLFSIKKSAISIEVRYTFRKRLVQREWGFLQRVPVR